MGHQTVQNHPLTIMKFFVLFALAGAAVAHPSTRNNDEGAAAALACTAGTSLGENLATAFSTCFGDDSIATMRKVVKKMQLRNAEECYSYEEIMEWVMEEYADDACVLQTIGWMNENFDFNAETIESDVTSLDPVVTAPLFEHHEGCVAEVMDYVEDHECASTFSDEEQDSLLDTTEKIATYECFLHSLSRVAWSTLRLLSGNKKKTRRENFHEIFEINLIK